MIWDARDGVGGCQYSFIIQIYPSYKYAYKYALTNILTNIPLMIQEVTAVYLCLEFSMGERASCASHNVTPMRDPPHENPTANRIVPPVGSRFRALNLQTSLPHELSRARPRLLTESTSSHSTS